MYRSLGFGQRDSASRQAIGISMRPASQRYRPVAVRHHDAGGISYAAFRMGSVRLLVSRQAIDLEEMSSSSCGAGDVDASGHRHPAAAALVRRTLSMFVEGRHGPGDWTFAREPDGKPVVMSREEVCFSVSYAAGQVFVVVANASVGIDAEAVDAAVPVADLVPFLSGGEREQIRADDSPGSRLMAFWTLKEAILKQSGAGLTVDPVNCELELPRRLRPAGLDNACVLSGHGLLAATWREETGNGQLAISVAVEATRRSRQRGN